MFAEVLLESKAAISFSALIISNSLLQKSNLLQLQDIGTNT